MKTELDYWRGSTLKLLRDGISIAEILNELDNIIIYVAENSVEDITSGKILLSGDLLPVEKREYNQSKGFKRKLIDKSLKISDVAKVYGLSIKNGKIECPYHQDEDPSCKLDDTLNIFYCFGCGAKGDIIELTRKLNEVIKHG